MSCPDRDSLGVALSAVVAKYSSTAGKMVPLGQVEQSHHTSERTFINMKYISKIFNALSVQMDMVFFLECGY